MFRAHVLIVRRAKIVLYSHWYHHTYRWPSRAQVLSQSVHGTATYRYDTRDCIIQFWPPDDEHLCSKHEEAWNKFIIKFSAPNCLILKNKYNYVSSAHLKPHEMWLNTYTIFTDCNTSHFLGCHAMQSSTCSPLLSWCLNQHMPV